MRYLGKDVAVKQNSRTDKRMVADTPKKLDAKIVVNVERKTNSAGSRLTGNDVDGRQESSVDRGDRRVKQTDRAESGEESAESYYSRFVVPIIEEMTSLTSGLNLNSFN